MRRGGEEMQTHANILTFKKPTIPKEVKFGYSLEIGYEPDSIFV